MNHFQLLDKTEATTLFHSNRTKMLPTYLRHTGTKDEASCPLLGNSKHPLEKEEKCASCRTIPPGVRTLKKYIIKDIIKLGIKLKKKKEKNKQTKTTDTKSVVSSTIRTIFFMTS